jgi:capsular polysaccharide biosynthesis protein
MHEKQPRFVREFLALLNFKKIIAIKDDELVKARRAYFPSHIARPLAYNETVMRDLSGWLFEKLNDDAVTNSPEKIFISRKNARYRITHNEDKIQAYLESLGFAVITPEEYTIHEQMNLFKKARIIIGSHGAGFSNLVYAPQCELIIDIIHKEHHQDCFYNLASTFATDYYYFQCEGRGTLTYKNNDDVVADIDEFKRQIEPLIK